MTPLVFAGGATSHERLQGAGGGEHVLVRGHRSGGTRHGEVSLDTRIFCQKWLKQHMLKWDGIETSLLYTFGSNWMVKLGENP
jgi:hypothetical protein